MALAMSLERGSATTQAEGKRRRVECACVHGHELALGKPCERYRPCEAEGAMIQGQSEGEAKLNVKNGGGNGWGFSLVCRYGFTRATSFVFDIDMIYSYLRRQVFLLRFRNCVGRCCLRGDRNLYCRWRYVSYLTDDGARATNTVWTIQHHG